MDVSKYKLQPIFTSFVSDITPRAAAVVICFFRYHDAHEASWESTALRKAPVVITMDSAIRRINH